MISIIVPVYNCVHTIEQCIKAIYAQTISCWELLLIDDGSTDGSGEICDQWGVRDSRIKVIHKSNGGVSSARNTGLDNAGGEYVMFCDSDDWAENNWCELLLNTLLDHPDDLCLCNYYRNGQREEINRGSSISQFPACIAKSDFFLLNKYELLGIPWNKIFRRDIINRFNLRFKTDLSLGEDLMFNLDYLHHMDGDIRFVNEPLYHYRLGTDSNLSVKYYANLEDIYLVLYQRIKDEMNYMNAPGARWKEYSQSFFYAYERVFRNTYSKKNKNNPLKKLEDNIKAFHSDAFQECRKEISKGDINILQYYGLSTNSYILYSLLMEISEAVHKLNK